MKVIVDTSVWSQSLRKKKTEESPQTIQLRKLIENQESIFLLGVIIQEILQGVRDNILFQKIQTHLKSFTCLNPQKEDYISCAQLYNKCLSHGVTPATTDILIAHMTIKNHCHLLTTDKDFDYIAKYSELKLLK